MCRKSCTSLKQLIVHFKHIHRFTSGKVSYIEPGCFRMFTSLKSFKKHFKVEHMTTYESSCDKGSDCRHEEIQDPVQDTSDSMFANETDSALEMDSSTNETESTSDMDNADKYVTEFRQHILIFVSSLYNNIAIPRSQIQDIITYVTLIFKSKLFAVKKVVTETIKTNCKLATFIDSCFSAFENTF